MSYSVVFNGNWHLLGCTVSIVVSNSWIANHLNWIAELCLVPTTRAIHDTRIVKSSRFQKYKGVVLARHLGHGVRFYRAQGSLESVGTMTYFIGPPDTAKNGHSFKRVQV